MKYKSTQSTKIMYMSTQSTKTITKVLKIQIQSTKVPKVRQSAGVPKDISSTKLQSKISTKEPKVLRYSKKELNED